MSVDKMSSATIISTNAIDDGKIPQQAFQSCASSLRTQEFEKASTGTSPDQFYLRENIHKNSKAGSGPKNAFTGSLLRGNRLRSQPRKLSLEICQELGQMTQICCHLGDLMDVVLRIFHCIHLLAGERIPLNHQRSEL